MRLYFILFILPFASWSQEKTVMETNFTIGETNLKIYESSPTKKTEFIFLNVHEDENTSIDVLHAYSLKEPIHFFYLKHLQTRRIEFQLQDKTYNFDPNRIFTKKGRKNTLKDGELYSAKANRAVKQLAKEIIERIKNAKIVIAVHNNTDVNYSIKSYLPGGDEAQNTANIHINPDVDADDFIYTTDQFLFNAFKEKNVNVILQDNKGYVNDGSLSVYCGKNEIPYINIETQKGHFNEQMNLMTIVLNVIRSYK